MWAPLFGLHVDKVISKKKWASAKDASRKTIIELFKILRFNQQFSENYVFDCKFYTRQAGECLQIHTRQSKISLAMASQASIISTPAHVCVLLFLSSNTEA